MELVLFQVVFEVPRVVPSGRLRNAVAAQYRKGEVEKLVQALQLNRLAALCLQLMRVDL